MKVQMINVFNFVGHTVCVTASHLCCFSGKVAVDNTWTNDCDFIPTKLYLQKEAIWIWPESHSWPIFVIDDESEA